MSSITFVVLLIVVFGLVVGFGYAIFRTGASKAMQGPSLDSDAEGHYEVLGKRIVCLHCGEDIFEAREILLNTWLLSLLSLEWLDSGSTVLVCQNCGRLTWFSQAKSE